MSFDASLEPYRNILFNDDDVILRREVLEILRLELGNLVNRYGIRITKAALRDIAHEYISK